MSDRYLLESSLVDGYLLEDGSGVLLLESQGEATSTALPSPLIGRGAAIGGSLMF